MKKSNFLKVFVTVMGLTVVFWLVYSLLSSPIISTGKYRNLIEAVKKFYIGLLSGIFIGSTFGRAVLRNTQAARERLTVTGKISKVTQATVEEESRYYLMLEGEDATYDVNVAENLDIIRYDVQDEITLEYIDDGETKEVLNILNKDLSARQENAGRK